MRALILCNGEPPSRTLVRRAARWSDMTVAADGGAEIARRYNVIPDLITGDFDSVADSTLRHFRHVPQRRVRRQDNTDLEKALDAARAAGAMQVLILGAEGGRVDFTLANLAVLWNYDRSMNLRSGGDGWYVTPVRRAFTVSAPVGTTVSLLPAGTCSGVRLRGFRYSLTNATLPLGQIGVSNVMTRSRAYIRLGRGQALLVVFEDPLDRW